MPHVHVIAEAGTNHNGSVAEALLLASVAARSKADSVKFQIINPWGLYLPGEYEYGHYKIADVIALRHQTVLPDEAYRQIAAESRANACPMSASVFDEKGLELLLSLNPPYVKLASTDLTNHRLIRAVAKSGYPMVMSTGMSSIEDVDRAVGVVSKERNLDSVVLMHCVSVYPVKTEETNLGFISRLRERFGTQVGFSDHTLDSRAACMAVALGVTWIEKHFTRDRTQKGLDHAYAMEEHEFANYVSDLRAAESALREPVEKVSESEAYTRRRARRALYSAKALVAGTTVADEHVLVVRPEGPMGADEIDLVVGRTLKTDLPQYAAFRPEHFA